MIVVDTSAIIAMLTDEPDAALFRQRLAFSDASAISVVSLVEATMVGTRTRRAEAAEAIDEILTSYEIAAAPVDRAQAELARQAFLMFGKGRNKAALNICDCFVYALAKSLDAPILFKGADFALTDAKIA